MMEIRRGILLNCDPILPPGYQRVEYIRAKTYAYIETPYVPIQGDEFEIEYMADVIDSNMRCLMSAGTGTYQLIALGYKSSNCQGYYYLYFATGGAVEFKPLVEANQWYKMTISSDGTISENGYTKKSSYQHELDGSSTNLWIFRRRNTNNPFVGKLKSFKITNNGVLKMNLIPCIRKSDNEAGAYDTIAKIFRGSSSYLEHFTPSTLDN